MAQAQYYLRQPNPGMENLHVEMFFQSEIFGFTSVELNYQRTLRRLLQWLLSENLPEPSCEP